MSAALEATLRDALVRDMTRATRALLRRPLIRHDADPDAFQMVRRHAAELRDWFDSNTGWRLHVDTRGRAADQVGRPACATRTHPAREPRSHLPLQPPPLRAAVPGADGTGARRRADHAGPTRRRDHRRGRRRAARRAGVTFELSGREERGDLVAVVRLLLELGVLARVAGDEEAFVRDAGDVLYDVERRVLAVLITAPRGPSTIVAQGSDARLARANGRARTALGRPPHPRDSPPAHSAAARRPGALLRRASEAELAYLPSQRSALTKRICERTGLVAEMRAEGIAMVDPRDELTDVRMPEVGTDGHVTLLVAEYLAARADDGSGCPTGELHALVRRLANEHQALLAPEHPRSGGRGRTRGARARAARGAAPDPPRR